MIEEFTYYAEQRCLEAWFADTNISRACNHLKRLYGRHALCVALACALLPSVRRKLRANLFRSLAAQLEVVSDYSTVLG